MIRAINLTKRFGDNLAVDALNLEAHDGEVLGMLGPNGAGKTTTIRMLSCLIAPTSGEAWVAGKKVGEQNDAIRAEIGILTEAPGLYDKLSAYRNLDFFAKMYGVPAGERAKRIEKYLSVLGLWERRKEAVGTFSKGMRQKMAIARTLLHEPRVLFLDEPTSGLDPESAKTVRDFVEELRGQGRTVLLCTHNLEEADRLCDRIAIFRRSLIDIGTVEDLRGKLFGHQTVIRLRQQLPGVADMVRNLPLVKSVTVEGDTVTVDVTRSSEANPAIVRAIVEGGGEVLFVEEKRHSLENVYLSLVGGSAQ
ncbi:MAG: ABC transporter ATP-binding protein [Chloroflexota bacterium]